MNGNCGHTTTWLNAVKKDRRTLSLSPWVQGPGMGNPGGGMVGRGCGLVRAQGKFLGETCHVSST